MRACISDRWPRARGARAARAYNFIQTYEITRISMSHGVESVETTDIRILLACSFKIRVILVHINMIFENVLSLLNIHKRPVPL